MIQAMPQWLLVERGVDRLALTLQARALDQHPRDSSLEADMHIHAKCASFDKEGAQQCLNEAEDRRLHHSVDLKSLRIAFHTDNGIASPTPETVAVVQNTAAVLSEAGMVVAEERPQGIEQAYETFFDLFAADGGAGIQQLLQMAGTTERHPMMQRLLDLLPPRAMSTAAFCAVLFKWDMFRSGMLAFLEQYDVILCPVNASPALPHGTTFDNLSAFSYTMTYNLTGWPGAVVRGGTSPEGLPIGVQVVARPWREDVALAVAQHIETAWGGWQRAPL